VAANSKWNDQNAGPIRAFGWPLVVQAGGLAQLSGARLQLTTAGRKALAAPAAETIQTLWTRWLGTTIFDELSRIDCVKGQTGKGERILDERYLYCLLLEYAATLGMIDAALIPPAGARGDYRMIGKTTIFHFSDYVQYFKLLQVRCRYHTVRTRHWKVPTVNVSGDRASQGVGVKRKLSQQRQ
jgi:hypothetical protein